MATGMVAMKPFSGQVNERLSLEYEFDDFHYKSQSEAVVTAVEHYLYANQAALGIEENTSDGEQILLATDNDLKQTKTADYEDVDGDARDRVATRDNSEEFGSDIDEHSDAADDSRTERQLHARLPGEEQQPGGAGTASAGRQSPELPLLDDCDAPGRR